jgi:two-component system LytT family response regulator
VTETGPLRAVVVDDEPAGREVLTSFLAREPEIELVGEAANGDEAVDLVRSTRPDLLFLDIQMPDRDGFGVIEALGADVPRGIVFVTAHDEHALRAFEVHALDYLLKPFGFARFHATAERAIARLRLEPAASLGPTLDSVVDGRRGRGDDSTADLVLPGGHAPGAPGPAPEPAPLRFGVRKGTRTRILDASDIDWIEAAGDYARLHAGDESHLLSIRMHELEERLDASFFRIHRSVIVRLATIRELVRDPGGGGVAVLVNGVRLRVARTRWDALEEALGLI